MTHDASGRPIIRLQTLGAAAIGIGAAQVDPSAGMLFALLVRLAYAPAHTVARDALVSGVWTEHSEARRGANLRQALYKLRQMGVRTGIVGELVTVDAEQFAPTFSLRRTAERFAADVTCGTEPFGLFLPGYATGRREFDEWLAGVRDAVHADVRRVLVAELRVRRDRADWLGADAMARWLLQFDPLNEDATLTYAECTARNGSKAEAIAIIDRYLAEVGPEAGDIRVPATILRRRIGETPMRPRRLLAPADRHFVGREELMATLTLSMRRARWHDGSATLLHGAPGIGKTRLVQELAKVAALEGFRVLTVECRGADSHRPLSVFLGLIPTLLELPGAMGCEPENMSVLRRLAEPDRRDCHAVEDSTHPTVSNTSRGRELARRAILDCIIAVADEQPLLLIVENIDSIDSASSTLLADLSVRIPTTRVAIVHTARERRALRTLVNVTPRAVSAISVQPLTPTNENLLLDLIGADLGAEFPDDVRQWITSAAQGHPMFAAELAVHWTATGSQHEIPPTLEAILDARLADLESDTLQVLQVVVLLGQSARIDFVEQVLSLPTHKMIEAIEPLQSLTCVSYRPAGHVSVHDLLAVRVRSTMPSIIRYHLHRKIARCFENDASLDRTSGLLIKAGQHLILAEEYDALGDFIDRNLGEILAGPDPRAARDLLHSARYRGTSNIVRITRAHARLELEAGEYGNAIAIDSLNVAIPDNLHALAESEVDHLITVIDAAYRADPLMDAAHLAAQLAAISSLTSIHSSLRLRACEVGLVIAANVCDRHLATQFFENATQSKRRELIEGFQLKRIDLLYHTIFGDRKLALSIADEHLEHGLSLGVTSEAYTALSRAGFAYRLVGSSEQALRAQLAAMNVSRVQGTRAFSQFVAWQLSQTLLDMGDLEQANVWNRELQVLFSVDTDRTASNFVVAHFCRMAIEQSQSEAARRWLDQYSQRLARIPAIKSSAYHIALTLGVSLMDPQWEPPHELIEVGIDRHTRTCQFGTSDFFSATLCNALNRCNRQAEAQKFWNHYLHVDRREIRPVSPLLKVFGRRV